MTPAFPQDATITSIHLACVYAGRAASLQSSLKEGYSYGYRLQENPFGFKAAKLAELLFGNDGYAKELTLRHSLLPWEQDPATSFGLRMIESISLGDRAALSSIAGAKSGIKMTTIPRICKTCRIDDLSAFGFAHLHVLHQVPGIHFCHVHGDRLGDQCASCHTSLKLDGPWRLEGDICLDCGGTETSASFLLNKSPASQEFAKLLTYLLTGRQRHLTPRMCRDLVEELRRARGWRPPELVAHFTAWWQAEHLQEVSNILDVQVDAMKIVSFIRGEVHSLAIPMLTALLAYARHQKSPLVAVYQ